MKTISILILNLVISFGVIAEDNLNLAPQEIIIELNRLQQEEQNCATYFRINNPTPMSFTAFKVEMITFNQDGLINNRILGDFKKIRSQKTVVKIYGIPDTRCAEISKILINEVRDCTHSSSADIDCLDLLKPAFKGDVELFK